MVPTSFCLQGHRRLTDFDISKEAGGVQRAIAREFKVNVSENYLEIHLVWAGKGTCCIPVQGYYGPLIATVHAASGNKNEDFSILCLVGVKTGTEEKREVIFREKTLSNCLNS